MAARRSAPLFPVARPGRKTQALVREVLRFAPGPEKPREVRTGRRWTRDGVDGEEISWWVGYGPRTRAWLLRPEGAKGKLPGLVALHDHGGYKYHGKEKIAEGPSPVPAHLKIHFKAYYGGRPLANALAREGYAVLVHDTFQWGSRRFPLRTMPEPDLFLGRLMARSGLFYVDRPKPIALYNCVAASHENTLSKYCATLGTSIAGIVAFEDRVAVEYLASRNDVDSGRLGCVGLSGGGTRSVFLQGTCRRIRAAVVVGAMTSCRGLLDHNVVSHNWMLFPPGLSRHLDWAGLVACRAPSPLLVQNARHDPLYSPEGMREAHRQIAAHYRFVGRPGNYRGEFYDGPHRFHLPMQRSAFAWLARWLCPGRG